MIWKVASDVPFGHIAVITEVNLEVGYIRIAEQNVDNDYWPGNYARELKLEIIDGHYWIRDDDETYGWMVINFDVDGQDQSIFNIDEPVHRIITERENDNISWLDLSNPAQDTFSKLWGNLLENQRKLEYYTMEAHFAYRIHYLTLECHHLCCRAVDHILKDDLRLAKFGVPEWSWPLIRDSWREFWEADGKCILTRLEFGFNGKQLKLLGNSVDPIEGLLEAVVLQDKWAKHHSINIGKSATNELYENLLWQINDAVTGFVHILTEKNEKHEYKALYLQQLLLEAGHDSKIVVGINFARNEKGKFIDENGLEIKTIWKTWQWEAVFADYDKPRINNELKISDILLSKDIQVLEPIWKVIAGNRALLPFLWELFPNHAALLRAEWNTDDYFNSNPSIPVPIGYTHIESNHHQPIFYREVFESKQFEDNYPRVYSWPLKRRLSGFCIIDYNSSNISQSPFVCCRVIRDN